MDLLDFIKKNLDLIIKLTSAFFVFSYIFGFIAWNVYLSQFGYFESSFLQTRFLSAGITMTIIYLAYIGSLIKIYNLIKNSLYAKNFSADMLGTMLVVVLFVPWYSYVIFPRIPQFLGGAHPFAKSIIASEDEIRYFSSLNLIPTPNSGGTNPIQTEYLCEIYNNENITIIGKSSMGNFRVLILKKDLFKGFQVVPLYLESYIRSEVCKSFVTRSYFWPLKN